MIKKIESLSVLQLEHPDNEPVNEKIMRLRKDYEFKFVINEHLFHGMIKAGFLHDGSSIPRLVWTCLGLTPAGISETAALPHDVFYITKGFRKPFKVKELELYAYTRISRKVQDELYRRFLIYSGVKKLRANIAYPFLRAGGYFKYDHPAITI